MQLSMWGKGCFLLLFLMLQQISAFAADALPSGLIGVGSWRTQVEFKDIRVTGPDGTVLFNSGEIKDLSDWYGETGVWEAKEGALVQTSTDAPAFLVLNNKVWNNCTLSLKARKTGGAEGFLIAFQAKDALDRHWWDLGGWGNTQSGLEGLDLPVDKKPISVETGRWYDIKVEMTGAQVRCYLDGKMIHDVTRSSNANASNASASNASTPNPSGFNALGVGTWNTQAEFKDIRVTGLDGKVLYNSGAMKDLTGWKTEKGQWTVKDGVLIQTGSDMPALALLDKSLGDCILTLKARKTGGDEGFLIPFQIKSFSEKHWWNIAGWSNKQTSLEGSDFPSTWKDVTIQNGRWYDIKVEMNGQQVRCSFDGSLFFDVIRK